jgi:hypothetical protein
MSISKLEKELLLCEIKEPNKAEFDQFKKEFLYSKQRMQIARTARKFIYDLEDCIVFLKRQLDKVQKLTPKEYKELLLQIKESRRGRNKLINENQLLLGKIARLQEENKLLRENSLKLINKEL